jgi:hypothetical protein
MSARQAQCAPPAPHPPVIGEEALLELPFELPTIPGLERRFTRFAPWHPGHSAVRSVVTNASNSRSQSPQRYSKIGMVQL